MHQNFRRGHLWIRGIMSDFQFDFFGTLFSTRFLQAYIIFTIRKYREGFFRVLFVSFIL